MLEIVFLLIGLAGGIILGLALAILWVFKKLELPKAKEVFEKLTPHLHSAGVLEPMTAKEAEIQDSEWNEFNKQLET